MDWLTETQEQFKEYESPQRFYYWSCLAAVSAILKDSVFIRRGKLYNLYPNVYILLFGPSAVKKGPPINLAKSIVNGVNNTRVINGRATVEAIIKELGTIKTLPGGHVIKDSCGFIVSSEMSSSLISSTSSLDIITDLADRIWNDSEWTHRTKGADSVELNNPTITWLAGTNEALFREFIPEKNLKGGLIGRTFVIAENKGNGLNSLMFDPEISPDKQKIIDRIMFAKNLKGEFKIDNTLRKQIDTWYHKFMNEIAPKLEDDTGTVGRTLDNILKLCMLISTARRGDMQIIRDDFEESWREVISLYSPTKRISNSAKTNELGIHEKRSLFIHYLANCEEASAPSKEIMQKFSMQMDHEDIDRIVTGFERMGVLKIVRPGANKDIIYSLNLSDPRIVEYVKAYRK